MRHPTAVSGPSLLPPPRAAFPRHQRTIDRCRLLGLEGNFAGNDPWRAAQAITTLLTAEDTLFVERQSRDHYGWWSRRPNPSSIKGTICRDDVCRVRGSSVARACEALRSVRREFAEWPLGAGVSSPPISGQARRKYLFPPISRIHGGLTDYCLTKSI